MRSLVNSSEHVPLEISAVVETPIRLVPSAFPPSHCVCCRFQFQLSFRVASSRVLVFACPGSVGSGPVSARPCGLGQSHRGWFGWSRRTLVM